MSCSLTPAEARREITEGWLKAFRSALRDCTHTPADIHPDLWQAHLAGLRSQIESLELELASIEAGDTPIRKFPRPLIFGGRG